MIRLDGKSFSGYILVYAGDYVLFAIDTSGVYNNNPDTGGIYMWYMPENKDIFDLTESKCLKIIGVDVL